MKPFNLEDAKAGKPVCQRDGRPVRILAFDIDCQRPIAVAIPTCGRGDEEFVALYPQNGKWGDMVKKQDRDLMMVSRTVTAYVATIWISGGQPTSATFSSELEIPHSVETPFEFATNWAKKQVSYYKERGQEATFVITEVNFEV